jgi:hypothetical protein
MGGSSLEGETPNFFLKYVPRKSIYKLKHESSPHVSISKPLGVAYLGRA